MQKVMLFLASMLIVFSLSSCSNDDDSAITISPKEVTMKVDEIKQLQTTGDIQKWRSEDNFIASVSPTGAVTANHVGETNVMASGNGNSATCKIVVEPQYSYYIEPLCQAGITKADVKRFEKRNLRSETSDGLFYDGENALVSAVAYQFDSNGKLNFVMLMIPHHNSTVLAKQLINFLLERYNPVADLDGVYTFVDANSLKDAHKIMYMEVSPKGYYNYISIIYKVNTSK